MKKRMFLSTILMTLVLLLAVTTATFAWYTATGAGTAAKGEVTGSSAIVTADSVTLNANASYFITFEVEEVTAKKLYLSEAVGGNLVTYFVDSQGYAVAAGSTSHALGDARVLSKLYKVTATLCTRSGEEGSYVYTPVADLTSAQLAELHAINENISVSLSATAVDTLSVDHTCHLAPAAEDTVEGTLIADAAVSFAINPSTYLEGTWTGTEVTLGYFTLRIDGNNATTTVGQTAQKTTGNVTATITIE